MKTRPFILLVSILLLACAFGSVAQATTVTAGGGAIPTIGDTRDYLITADSYPNGLLGLNMTVRLTDPSKAEIVGVHFPDWAPPLFSISGPVPADSVYISVFDMNGKVEAGATGVILANITVRGDAAGTTNLTVVVNLMQDDHGAFITPQVREGVIPVGSAPSTGSLNVTSSPQGATIYLDDAPKGTTPQLLENVPAGTHTIRLELAGYQTWSASAVVMGGAVTNVHAVLTPVTPETGSLHVVSTPPGASIYVDNVLKGTSNATISGIAPGTRTVKLVLGGYQDWEQSFAVTAGTTTEVAAVLVPVTSETGSLHVVSTPPGAGVYVDNVLKGTSNATISGIAPGTRAVKLVLSGYENWEQSFAVTAGATTEVAAVLVPVTSETGSLHVMTTPGGADIYVDNVFRGTSNTTVTGISPGSHAVRLVLDGYQPWESTVTILAGTTTEIDAVLTPVPPETGSLHVVSTPPGASIYVDNVLKGTSNATISGIAPGTRTVKLVLSGYQDWEQSFSVTAGATTEVAAVLVPVPPSAEPGYLTVFTFPIHVQAKINGNVLGTTPLIDAIVEPGIYTLTLSAPGYKDYQTTITIVSEQTLRLPLIIMQKGTNPPPPTLTPTVTTTVTSSGTGAISVKYTFPKNVDIYLNGHYEGKSPRVISGLAPGEYELMVTLPGYQTKTRTVMVQAGTTTQAPLIILMPLRFV